MKPWVMGVLLAVMLLSGCSNTGIPEGLEPVENLDVQRYLGQWHEIVRLDHGFEEGLEQVTATYSLREDGGVKVVNRGYNSESGEWEEAEGKAYFIEDDTTGRLKVSFFGPFYGGYNIIELDEDYQYAMITGPDRSYFWLLFRSPEPDAERVEQLVNRADELGFDTDAFIYPKTRTNSL
ncbi:lipocalin family protein [Marinimicrobium sp. ARAG 43.8]|uniref:lipocalin family protein n=1 Tax=Marinimicrobium sp. ARAG 43.8 TaxID=3418719 RepID=UPI003CF495F9